MVFHASLNMRGIHYTKMKNNEVESVSSVLNYYLGILALEEVLVPKASSEHRLRVAGPARKARSLYTVARELGIAEIVAQYEQDIQNQSHGKRPACSGSSCSSNLELPMSSKSEPHTLPPVLDMGCDGHPAASCSWLQFYGQSSLISI